MKIIPVICFVLCFHASFCQEKDVAKRYLDGTFSLTTRNKMVYPAHAFPSDNHWVLQATYLNNAPLLTVHFKDKNLTVMDGPYELYFPNKMLARSGDYRNGYRNGVWRSWIENGRLQDSGAIINNQLVGTWHTWHHNGNLAQVIDYTSDPTSFKASADSKIPLKQTTMVPPNNLLHGNKDGRFIRYYQNRQMSDSGRFSNNKKTGLWKIWFDTGQLEATGNFVDDSLQGEWTWYRENGTIATKETYKQNKLVSLQCFDETGKFTGDYCNILKPPVPLGNYVDFDTYVLDNIILPKELRNTRLEGVVKINCTISKDGKVMAVKIDGCRYESLQKEIEKFFVGIKEWSPAILHNRPVDYEFQYTLPLSHPY